MFLLLQEAIRREVEQQIAARLTLDLEADGSAVVARLHGREVRRLALPRAGDVVDGRYDAVGHFWLRVTRDGQTDEYRLHSVIDRGVWRPEARSSYLRGDAVSLQGSLWISRGDAPQGRPGTDDSGWRLAVKRGADGRTGPKGDKGEAGAPCRGSERR